jgi:hypothetical protein
MARQLGLQDGILARTVAPLETNGEPVDDQADAENGQSRGGLRTPRPRRTRRRLAGEKVSGRKLQLRDAVFERLQLAAIKRRTNPSAIADEILDRNLPKLKITSEE